MHQSFILVLFWLILPLGNTAFAAGGCTTKDCHAGIRDIVPMELEMMQLIKNKGQKHGDPDGCVICHGGNPNTRKKKKAHQSIPRSLKTTAGPKDFYPAPGALSIAHNTCGACHAGYVTKVKQSLMNTEAGKIQGNLATWGIPQVQGKPVVYGNYDIQDNDGKIPVGTSPHYQAYMDQLIQTYPGLFPDQLAQIPRPILSQIETDPQLAAFTYQRQACQQCHLGVKGKAQEGDYRGLGCAACHIPYAVDGFYQGEDVSIPKTEAGHIQYHRIQGNKKTGGIATQTCVACHNRGKRIGVSFQGRMETPWATPFDANGNPAPKRHGKNYIRLSQDLHHNTDESRFGNPAGGLLCQDCHTGVDVHGDGNIHGTTLGQVEIECTDCHGTPDQWPWELPLGYGEPFESNPQNTPSRGLGKERLLSDRQFGYPHDPKDGFLLTARGNPLGNVVKDKDRVIVYSAAGKTFRVPVLKQIHQSNRWHTPRGKTAMVSVSKHLERMECYACHSAWAPQCYGCHVNVDYSRKDPAGIDWVALGNADHKNAKPQATITESPSYFRWESPILGINGENRISPLIPGCQVVYTVKDKNGRVLVENQMPKNRTEAKDIGQAALPLAIDMAPVHPHTNQRSARSCEDCHSHPKTSGLGMPRGIHSKQQIDWSRVSTKEGTQLVTVGTHWPLSRAFNKTEIERVLKVGTCMGCHQNMADPEFWNRIKSKKGPDPVDHQKIMDQALKQMKQHR